MYPEVSLQICCTVPDEVTDGTVTGIVVADVVVVEDTEVVAVVAPGRFPKNPVEPPAYGFDTCTPDLTVTVSPEEQTMLLVFALSVT